MPPAPLCSPPTGAALTLGASQRPGVQQASEAKHSRVPWLATLCVHKYRWLSMVSVCSRWCERPCKCMAAACRLLLERAQELAVCLAPLVRRECAALVQDIERFVLAPLAMSEPSERVPVRRACFCQPVCLSSRPVAGL